MTDHVLAFLGLPRKADTKSMPVGMGKDAIALKTDPYYTRSEIAAMAKREKIIHLDDLVLRRTLLGYLGQLTRPLVEGLANILGESLGWDGTQKKAEVERAIKILAESHGVRL